MDEITVIDWELDDSEGSSVDLITSCNEIAENGDTEAQRILASAYYYGIIVEKDRKKALMWLKRAAEEGDDRALASLGEMYQKGEILEKDMEKGFHLKKASRSGYIPIMVRLAFCYEQGLGTSKDLRKAMAIYEEAEKNGNLLARYRLALIYIQGKDGIEKNLLKAFAYAFSASKMGYPPALGLVGMFYMSGDVVNKDIKKGIECFELAMRLGHMPSKCRYATELIRGENIEQNIPKGIGMLSEMADEGITSAMYSLGMIYYSGKSLLSR